jgi:uncharacterized membrane protein (UPF0127 family)
MISDLILVAEPFVLAASHASKKRKLMIMKNDKKRITFFIFGCVIFAAVALQIYKYIDSKDVAGFNRDLKNYNAKLQIYDRSSNKIADFKIAIADTEEKKMYGLMFLEKLPKEYGMLFPFKESQLVMMWMKNTKIPLDMIFIDVENEIATIAENAKPGSLELISSGREVKYVLEINAGLARELGLEVRQRVQILRR